MATNRRTVGNMYPSLPYDEDSHNPYSYPMGMSTFKVDVLPVTVSKTGNADGISDEKHDHIKPQLIDDLRRFGHAMEEELTTPPVVQQFKAFSILGTIFSMVSCLVDIGSDIAAAYFLRMEKNTTWWFWFTVVLIVVPDVVGNAYSMYLYYRDEPGKIRDCNKPPDSKCLWAFRIALHCIGLGPIARDIDTLKYGLRSRATAKERRHIEGPYCRTKSRNDEPNYYTLLLQAEKDNGQLGLIHTFSQDAPQFALQLYILAVRPPYMKDDFDVITTITFQSLSAALSILSMSWCLVSYKAALRFSMEDKPNLSKIACLMQFFWRLFAISSRIISLVLFATVFRYEVFGVMAVHTTIMCTWIFIQYTHWLKKQSERTVANCMDTLYLVVIGWVYNFCFLPVVGGPNRLKYVFYYTITFAEDVGMMTLWYLHYTTVSAPWYHLPAIVGVPSAFLLGIIFMISYYRKFHPDGRMPNKAEKASLCC